MDGGGLKRHGTPLFPASEHFTDEPVSTYNLACYAAQLGRVEEAWEWLQKAIKVSGNAEHMQTMALADSDLKPLWERIRGL